MDNGDMESKTLNIERIDKNILIMLKEIEKNSCSNMFQE